MWMIEQRELWRVSSLLIFVINRERTLLLQTHIDRINTQVLEVLGEGEKYSFYFDNRRFFALGLFFVLMCTSLFIKFFLWKDRVKVVGSLSGEVHMLKKPGGRKKIYSVFEGFPPLIMCSPRPNRVKWSERRVIPLLMPVLYTKTNTP